MNKMPNLRTLNSEFTDKEWEKLADEERNMKRGSAQWLMFVMNVASTELDLRFRLKQMKEQAKEKKKKEEKKDG